VNGRLRLVVARLLCLVRRGSTSPATAHPAPGGSSCQIAVSGMEFCGGLLILPELRLGEHVRLIRDPGNRADRNAIRVETESGKQIGFINRDAAQQLAPVLDRGTTVDAYVSALEGGAFAQGDRLTVGVSIAGAPDQMPRMPVDNAPSAYFLDLRTNCMYLMINGSDQALDAVIKELGDHGFSCTRHAPSTRISQDGHKYDWFIVIEVAEAEHASVVEAVEQLFAERWGLRTKAEWAALDSMLAADQERIAVIEEELKTGNELISEYGRDADQARKEVDQALEVRRNFEAELSELHARVQHLQAAREECVALRQRIGRHDARMLEVLSAALPSVREVRGSLRTALSELIDPLPLIRLLQEVVYETYPVRHKPTLFRGADGWWEHRFRTGEDDQGRLYFRRRADAVDVLVSHKRDQNRDEQYLRKL
jgi:hypothetical protein